MRRSKYRNIPTVVDGIRFDSKKEAARYGELKLLEKLGKIRGLIANKSELVWAFSIDGVKICKYEADFHYWEQLPGGGLSWIVEDVKGRKTREYIIKRNLMKALYGIEIREV